MKRTALALIFALAVLTAGVHGWAQGSRAHRNERSEKAEKAKDPVCGMMVDKDPRLSTTHKGETYYFCSKADLEEFKKNPEKYARK